MKKITPLMFLLVLPMTFAAENPPRLSAEVLWQLQRVGNPVVSPDGDQVVVPVTTYPEDGEAAKSRLWLLSVDGATAQRPLTADEANASGPVFSPDGSRLAFVRKSGEEEPAQVYVMPMNEPGEAGEAYRHSDRCLGAQVGRRLHLFRLQCLARDDVRRDGGKDRGRQGKQALGQSVERDALCVLGFVGRRGQAIPSVPCSGHRCRRRGADTANRYPVVADECRCK